MSSGHARLDPASLVPGTAWPARLRLGLDADEEAGSAEPGDEPWIVDCVSVYDARTGKTTLIPVEPVTIPAGGTFRLNLGPEWTW